MPQNNPGREGLDASQTVYIDGPLELPTHLMHQDLETLGLTDLDALEDTQVMDTSNVLMPDGTMLEVQAENTAMDTTDSSNLSQSMDVDSMDDGNNTMDMDILNSPEVPSSQNDVPSMNQISIKEINNVNHKYVVSGKKPVSLNMSDTENMAPQILKTSLGQILFLQTNQNSTQNMSVGNRIVNVTSVSSASNVSIPAVSKAYTTTMPNNVLSKTQFRTIQVRPATSVSQGANTNNVTKFILNNQGISTQFKTVNVNSVADSNEKNDKTAPSKLTFQLQPITIPSSSAKTIIHNASTGSDGRTKFTVPFPLKTASSVTKIQSAETSAKPNQIFTTAEPQVITLPQTQSQTLQLSKKFNFIKLVNTSEPNGTNNATVQKIVNIKKPLGVSSQNLNIKTIHMPQNTINAVSISQVRPATSFSVATPTLSPQVLNSTQPGSLVMIPAHYVNQQLQSTTNTNTSAATAIQANSQTVSSIQSVQVKPALTKTVIDTNGLKARKPCNCTKSQCLKLYCDCFTNGEFCNNCNCTNCFNNLDHEEDRQKAIRACLDRNPNAFRPKIGKGGTQNERRHNKGCNCKRSGCLKNYCECYEAKIPCTATCKCVGCRNVDTIPPPEKRKLMQLAEVAESNLSQNVKNRPFSMPTLPSPVKMMFPSSGKAVHCRINQEVVEATCHCLLAQAEKAVRYKNSEEKAQLLIIEEFSRCIQQIIGCTKSKGV